MGVRPFSARLRVSIGEGRCFARRQWSHQNIFRVAHEGAPAAENVVLCKGANRHFLGGKSSSPVVASDQLSGPSSHRLTGSGRGVVIDYTESWPATDIFTGTMNGIAVKESDLALSQDQIYSLTLVNVKGTRDFPLAGVADEFERFYSNVRSRNNPQAAILCSGFADREISQDERWFDQDASRILVPAITGLGTRWLDPEYRIGQKHVVADEILDDIQ